MSLSFFKNLFSLLFLLALGATFPCFPKEADCTVHLTFKGLPEGIRYSISFQNEIGSNKEVFGNPTANGIEFQFSSCGKNSISLWGEADPSTRWLLYSKDFSFSSGFPFDEVIFVGVGEVEANVSDLDGNPIGGDFLRIERISPSEKGLIFTPRVGWDGKQKCLLPFGSYRFGLETMDDAKILLGNIGSGNVSLPMVVNILKPQNEISFIRSIESIIGGKVVDSEGRGQKAIGMILRREDGFSFEFATDQNGNFRIPYLGWQGSVFPVDPSGKFQFWPESIALPQMASDSIYFVARAAKEKLTKIQVIDELTEKGLPGLLVSYSIEGKRTEESQTNRNGVLRIPCKSDSFVLFQDLPVSSGYYLANPRIDFHTCEEMYILPARKGMIVKGVLSGFTAVQERIGNRATPISEGSQSWF